MVQAKCAPNWGCVWVASAGLAGGHKDGVEWGVVGLGGGGGSFCSYAFSSRPLGLIIYGGVLFKMHRRKITDVTLRFN